VVQIGVYSAEALGPDFHTSAGEEHEDSVLVMLQNRGEVLTGVSVRGPGQTAQVGIQVDPVAKQRRTASIGRLAKVSICWPGLHPPAKSVSNEKRILLCGSAREPHSGHWPV